MPVQSGEITNILLLLQGQHQCVLVALAKTVSQFTHNCTHIHPAPAHRVSYLHSLVLPCEAGTNFTYTVYMCVCPTAGVDWCFHIFFIPFCLYEQALCYPGGGLVTWWWSPVSAYSRVIIGCCVVAVSLWSLFVCCAVFAFTRVV